MTQEISDQISYPFYFKSDMLQEVESQFLCSNGTGGGQLSFTVVLTTAVTCRGETAKKKKNGAPIKIKNNMDLLNQLQTDFLHRVTLLAKNVNLKNARPQSFPHLTKINGKF